ncbi:Ppx/GppA phosphatase family protein [Amylibacter sp. IMCC11727]|uniref:Ppx/GppA phosphatase family protein n=1 Tax=Amylibacter sp. IMCC11727 TaxID=3039851 RepID=UPI00244DB03E|nr:Ppx/GppA phosphatase family protein [Amylibacter sp. IMCC11727]WGI20330.1 Ppx/GppA phosphatase family protein [Amylibacter sp. IMCC11727]
MRANNKHAAPKGRHKNNNRQPTATPDGGLFAALDLGTNSCRMLIARPIGSEFEVVDAFSKPVHLGAGLAEYGTLAPAAIKRTLGALRICGKKLRQHGVKHSRLVATEACRRARNGDSFVNLVKRETGLNLEIIDPAEEARLAVVSCAPHLKDDSDQLLIVDIGGGSTELVWLDLSTVAPKNRARAMVELDLNKRGKAGCEKSACIMDWKSVPLGVATLKDMFHDVDDDCAKFALMSCSFEEQIDEFVPPEIGDGARCQIIGTSGTVTTVAASHLGLARYERCKVDGVSMCKQEIDQVVDKYLSIGPEGRKNAPCIGSDRHELIMSGAAILQAILRVWPSSCLTVADRGLREGLLYSQMTAAGVLGNRPN